MGFDIAFGIIVLLAALRGYRKGFASQMALLAGLALGVLFAEPAAEWLSPYLASHVESYPKPVQSAIVYVTAAVGIWALITFAGWLYLRLYRQHVFGKNVPSLQDRVVGSALGFVKGAAVFCILLYLANSVAGRILAEPSVRQQYEASRIVQLDNQYQPIDRLFEWREVQDLRENVVQLVQYYRAEKESAAVPDADTAPDVSPSGSVSPLASPKR